MNKKFLAKVVLASVLVGGINLLPIQNIEVGNVQISAVAYAENKNFSAKEAAMTDVEIIEAQAKEASRMRAIEAVKEKIASYVRNYSGSKGKLSEDDIAAIAEKFEEVGTAKYKKLFYNAVDEYGRELGKVGIMYEATVTAKFNSKRITEHIKLTEQEKAKRIRQAKEAREKFEELDREYEELRKNARTKTPEQLQSEIKDFDDKISDLEKSRNKSAKTNKPVKKDKPTTSKGKSVANVPLKFLKSVQIGEVTLPPMGYFDIKKSDYHSGTPCTEKGYEHLGLYAKGIARFGNGDDALYFHYDANNGHYNGMVSRFGSQDFKNTVEDFPGIPTIVWKIKTNVGKTFYLLEHGDAAGFGSQITLIGKNEKGTFVKYFNTYKIKDTYLGEKNHRGIGDEWNKFTFQDNTIIIRYGQYGSYNKFNAIGEFRFKWDEKAQWFGVEQVIYNQTATEQKPTQENKTVTNQPMQFSQPVEIGKINYRPGLINGIWFEGDKWHKVNPVYNNTGIVCFGEGKNELFVYFATHYKYYLYVGAANTSIIEDYNSLNNEESYVLYNKLRTCEKNKTVIEVHDATSGSININRIDNNSGKILYFLYHNQSLGNNYMLLGPIENGKWVKYFGVNTNIYNGTSNFDVPSSYYCKDDTIIVEFKNNLSGKKVYEMHYKWDEKAQWFSVENIKY